MNDHQAGYEAGTYFVEHLQGRNTSTTTTSTNALFINDHVGISDLVHRHEGMKDAMESINNVIFEGLQLNSPASFEDLLPILTAQLDGCSYQVILLGTATPQEATIAALKANGCSFDELLIGVIDETSDGLDAIASGELDFVISQNVNLMGSFVVTMAMLFATTGQRLYYPGETGNGTYLSGPEIFTMDNLPTDNERQCTDSGFPVCSPESWDSERSVESCACTERPQIRLAGVTSGDTSVAFWDPIYSAMEQAADDFNVTLEGGSIPSGRFV